MFGSLFADPMRALIFAAAHLFGGSLGGGVFAVSLAVRVAFLPITIRLARRERERRRILARIEPELAKARQKFAKQPDRLAEALHAIHRREGIELVDSRALLGGLARLPALGGIYGALRAIPRLGSFAWIADLAKPNLPLALLVTTGSTVSAYVASHGLGTNARRGGRVDDRRSGDQPRVPPAHVIGDRAVVERKRRRRHRSERGARAGASSTEAVAAHSPIFVQSSMTPQFALPDLYCSGIVAGPE